MLRVPAGDFSEGLYFGSMLVVREFQGLLLIICFRFTARKLLALRGTAVHNGMNALPKGRSHSGMRLRYRISAVMKFPAVLPLTVVTCLQP
jgi:hypothetical protein